jgi:NADPH:quinone reductase-like Zn-dependent oxidoreductase
LLCSRLIPFPGLLAVIVGHRPCIKPAHRPPLRLEVFMSSSADTSIPEKMKAEVIDRFGPPDVMHAAVIPVPNLDANDVLIRIATAGVGIWDPYLCAGVLDTGAPFPRVLGSDGAGTVAAVGSAVRRFRAGDSVYAWGFLNPKGGLFAEYAALPEDEVSPLPGTLSFEEAGAMAVDGLTALAGLDQLGIGPGDSLMILGASGGVGHLALQLAKRIGARVFALGSGEDGVSFARQLGADEAVEGHGSDVVTKARAFAPNGFDGALSLVAANVEELLGLVCQGGAIAYPNGVQPEPSQRPGIRVQAFDGYHGREALDRLTRLVSEEPLHVEVSRMYALDAAPQALRDVTKHHLGKFVVQVQRRFALG